MERNRALAQALNLPDVDTAAMLAEPYSDALVAAARDNSSLVRSIETALRNFVSRGTSVVQHAFPVMKGDHRKIVHELAMHYNLLSASYDPEPNRNVVVFRSDLNDPRIPSTFLVGLAKAAVPKPSAGSAGAWRVGM